MAQPLCQHEILDARFILVHVAASWFSQDRDQRGRVLDGLPQRNRRRMLRLLLPHHANRLQSVMKVVIQQWSTTPHLAQKWGGGFMLDRLHFTI